jgi:hypothetical protein
MAIRDSQLKFSDAQVFNVGTDLESTSAFDIGLDGSQISQIGAGEQLFVEIIVDAQNTATGSETYSVRLVSDATTTLDSGSSEHSRLEIPADAVDEEKFYMAVPPAGNTEPYLQYLGLLFDLVDGGGDAQITVTCNLIPASMVDRADFHGATGYAIQDFTDT